MADDSDNREQGVEFGQLADDLDDEDYPIAHDELLDKYGDRELDLPSGSETLDEVLGAENEREYRDAEGVRQAVFNMVGSEAVGREGYSDRGSNPPESETSHEGESL